MPSHSEPAAAALPILDPQAQELAFLRATVGGQAEQILELKQQAGMRCAASRAMATKCDTKICQVKSWLEFLIYFELLIGCGRLFLQEDSRGSRGR